MPTSTRHTELIAGTTTFAALGSILLMVPIILAKAGLNPTHTFMVTALSAAISTALAGLWGRVPMALGPGLTMATFFVTELTGRLHLSTHDAFGMVILSALCMTLIIRCHWLKAFEQLIPAPIIQATTVGLGLLFLRLAYTLSDSYNHGILHAPEALLWLGTTAVILLLKHVRIQSAILIGILGSSLIAYMALPHTAPTTLQAAFHWQAPTLPNLLNPQILQALCTMTIVVLFDNTATLHAFLATLPKQHHPNPQQLNQTLLSTGLGSALAGLLGCTPSNVFLESKTGILAGGRQSLCALTIAAWCLIALALAPWMHWIHHASIASAMTIVALALIQPIRNWHTYPLYHQLSMLICAMLIAIHLSLMIGIGLGLALYYTHQHIQNHRKVPKGGTILWLLSLGYCTTWLL